MSNKPDFINRIIAEPLSAQELKKMARGHDGIIKFVVDIKKEKMAAGGKWHTDCREILTNNGSSKNDCWGAKFDVATGEVVYESQINRDRKENKSIEIKVELIRKTLKSFVDKFFEPNLS